MSDLSDGRITEEDEERLIAEALQRIATQRESAGLDLEFYEEQVRLLESLPPPLWPVDRRIELAWNIVRELGTHTARRLSCRAFWAAFPEQAIVRDRIWERRWLSALGALELRNGNRNLHEGLKLKAGAIRLAKEIGDRAGEANEISNLALMAGGAARYEDAIALSDAALATGGTALTPEICSITQLNRANALFRTGRLDEALAAAGVVLAAVEPPPTGRRLTNLVLAQVCVAEILIELDRATEARAVLLAARGWAERWDDLSIGGVARVEAQLMAAAGDISAGLREMAMLVERRGAHGSDFAGDGDLLDCLHAMYRIQRRAGDRAGALEALRRIGAVYMANAASTVAALVGLAEDVPIQLNAGKSGAIDRYLTLKSVEAGAVTHGDSRTWSYLVDAAANATSIEDGTLEHGPRVARLARYVAERMGEPPEVVGAIEVGALLHEVGKIGVSDVILRKTEPLDEQETELYAAHAEAGAQLLERADIPHKRVAVNVARYHHAPFDGHGGATSTLLGEAIPREARIVAVCDAFDAFVMGRPRRPAVSVQEALRDLLRQSGRDFDPRVVDALIATVRDLEREHGDVMRHLADAAGENDYFATQRLLRRSAEGRRP